MKYRSSLGNCFAVSSSDFPACQPTVFYFFYRFKRRSVKKKKGKKERDEKKKGVPPTFDSLHDFANQFH